MLCNGRRDLVSGVGCVMIHDCGLENPHKPSTTAIPLRNENERAVRDGRDEMRPLTLESIGGR